MTIKEFYEASKAENKRIEEVLKRQREDQKKKEEEMKAKGYYIVKPSVGFIID